MNENQKSAYFAAANGYSGFRSYFDTVFPSECFDRIYVIKGGPGTGKSSFMKRIRNECSDFSVESIYCSSDPKSLDGLIIKNGIRSVALLDGTAPHERDAVIPGAIDEIINFGEGWDTKWLTAQREKIIEKNHEKKKAYATAYGYLKTAGTADASFIGEYEKTKKHSALKVLFDDIFSDTKQSESYERETRLISSFGKSGEVRLNTFQENSEKIYSIRGHRLMSLIFLSALNEYLCEKKVSKITAPYVFDGKFTEALYLPEKKICFVIGDIDSSEKIDAEDYFEINDRTLKERERAAHQIRETALDAAKRWFGIASEIHFELEDIYIKSMNFENNDAIFERKLEEINYILKT